MCLPDELTQGSLRMTGKEAQAQADRVSLGFQGGGVQGFPHFAAKLAIESALREFDLPFTVIRPNYFFQNDVSLRTRC